MKKSGLIFCFMLASAAFSYAQTVAVAITHFAISQNPFAKDEIAVTATDSLGNTLENVNGMFNFTVNGLDDTLKFDKGVAFYRHKIIRSTFLYVRHQNDAGATSSILYYVYRTDDKLTPVHIAWIWLLAIPCVLILLSYMFKRFIIVAV